MPFYLYTNINFKNLLILVLSKNLQVYMSRFRSTLLFKKPNLKRKKKGRQDFILVLVAESLIEEIMNPFIFSFIPPH